MNKTYCDECEHSTFIEYGKQGVIFFKCKKVDDIVTVSEVNYLYDDCPLNRKAVAYIVKELIKRDEDGNLVRSANYIPLQKFNVDINDLRFLTTYEMSMQPGVEQNKLKGALKDYDYLIDYIVPSGAQSSNMNTIMVLANIFPYAPFFNLLEWQGRDKVYIEKRIPNMFYRKHT